MTTSNEMGPSTESLAITQLKVIAKAIHQLEGLPVDYGLAKKLADVADHIVRKYGY